MKITTSSHIKELRSAVEIKLGFEVTCTRDCIILSQELKRFDRRFSLSVSTLRRFFGIIKQKSPTSFTSLNALARYTGAVSYDKWKDHHFNDLDAEETSHNLIFKSENTPNQFDTRPETITNTIYILNQLIDQFEQSSTFRISPQKTREISQLTFYLLRIDAYPTETWKKLNRTPRARIFTEAFPPIDFLNGVGDIYMKDYLATSSSKEEKMFAKSLIASGLIYTGRNLKSSIKDLDLFEKYDTTIHPSPQARMLGLNLLALKNGIKTKTNQKKDFRKLILNGIENETELWPKWSSLTNIFKLRLAEWLILSNDVEFLKAFNKSIETLKSSQEITYKYDQFESSFEIFHAWSLFLVGKTENAISIIESIDLAKLSIHEERTISIYYYALTMRLYTGNKSSSSIKYLDLLTEQTKYHGLRIMLQLINNSSK